MGLIEATQLLWLILYVLEGIKSLLLPPSVRDFHIYSESLVSTRFE